MRGLVLALLILVTGCFKYVPVERTSWDVSRGVPVRARIDQQSIELRTYTAHDIVSMDAEFVRLDNSDIVLSALWLDSAIKGVGFPGEGWTVRIPMESLESLEQRKFDTWRSLAFVVAGFAVTYAGWQSIGGGGGGDAPPNQGGPIN
ncbi:MAG: hypothetical protein BMS9Abin29_2158 [Gemmatimonadota bacterium]|nr:MAG: hypothetical protein BMS9Abin29_2158 [Gemmatimonadota bacterium]